MLKKLMRHCHIKRTGMARKPLAPGESFQERLDADLTAVKTSGPLARSLLPAASVGYITD
jgi:hypothetical protein